MGQRIGIVILALILTAAIGALDYVMTHDLALGLVYFVPIALCAWYCSRRVTLVLCILITIVRMLFAPNPCPDYVQDSHVTMPHLCYDYIVGALIRLVFYSLWGLVIALVREQRQNIVRLGWESLTDSLTGLYNRRFLEARLKEEKGRADRHKRPMTLLMADIDHFKKFNDSHGHAKGDELLTQIAKVFRKGVREIDVVCRYGGEEFLVLLPETDGAEGEIVAERLREAVATGNLGSSGPVTISIGVATYPKDANSPELVILEADTALYKAKNAGRNRVFRANPEAEKA
jgi:diguanylate cyclase (GGDEF)-like protein